MALGALASNLSSSPTGLDGLKSALLCCQLFISIEQVRANFATMAQHIIRGLRIMHESQARPYLSAADKLVPAQHNQIPLLDVFIIRLFAAPCKFAEPPTRTADTADISGAMGSGCLISTPPQQSGESRDLRTIAPDMRTELTRIAALTLQFLGNASQVDTVGDALRLLSERAGLLESLDAWLIDLEFVQTKVRAPGPEPLAVSFMRLFHSVPSIVLLGVLDSSPSLKAELQLENDRLQGTAIYVEERAKAYKACSRAESGRGERDEVH